MSIKPLQDYLFQQVKEKLPKNVQLVDAVADLLHLSNDSAYRRIRGETPLVLDELQLLCNTYGISLDHLLQTRSNTASFNVMRVNNRDHDFGKYWTDLLQTLQWVASHQYKQIIYMTKDMPFIYNFSFRPIFAFRHFFWMKSILQHPDYVHRTFSIDCLPPEIEALGTQILKVYNDIPSIELWNTESFNSSLAQIDYYHDAGYFASDADAHMLYDSMLQLMQHMQLQAEWGCKFLPGENPATRPTNHSFYYNRVVLGDNTIVILTDDVKTLYINYDVLDYMVTQDEELCNNMYGKLQNLMRRSTLISSSSERQRHHFFNLLYQKIPKPFNKLYNEMLS